MEVKAGIRMIPTAVVLAVIGVVAVAFTPWRTLFDKGHDGVVVVVEFEPRKRTGQPLRPGSNLVDVVSIQWKVAEVPMEPTVRQMASPFSRVAWPGKGQTVEVYAEQFTGGRLWCYIVYNDKKLVRDEKSGPSFVRCRTTFTP